MASRHRQFIPYGPPSFFEDTGLNDEPAHRGYHETTSNYSKQEIIEKKIALLDFRIEKLMLLKVKQPTPEQQDQINYYSDQFEEAKNVLLKIDRNFVHSIQDVEDLDELQNTKLELLEFEKKTCCEII